MRLLFDRRGFVSTNSSNISEDDVHVHVAAAEVTTQCRQIPR